MPRHPESFLPIRSIHKQQNCSSSGKILAMASSPLISAKFDLVIFDFDGTLANSYLWFLSIYDELVDRFQLPKLTREELEGLRRLDVRQVSRQFNIPFFKIIQVGAYLKQRMANEIHQVQLVEGMQTVLDCLLEAGIHLAVVSSNAEENVRKVLGYDNSRHFDDFECGAAMFGKKSKLEKVLRKTGFLSSQALSIGDEIRDIKSSRQVGIAFGAVAWGSTELETLRKLKPEITFNVPADILEYIHIAPQVQNEAVEGCSS